MFLTHFYLTIELITRMWANAERDGRPAEYKWRISDVGVLTTASEL